MAEKIDCCGHTLVIRGVFPRIAYIQGEEWREGSVISNPEQFVADLKRSGLKARIFSFCQNLPEIKPKYQFHLEWDNYAAISLTNYEDWWKSLSQESRRNVRIAAKRGVAVREAELDNNLIEGIMNIYNETPIRQGRKFAHYGKSFTEVKEEFSTFRENTKFIAAYYNDELIGYARLMLTSSVASIISIGTKIKHYDKRPTNALMNRAVEIGTQKGCAYLTYRKFTYGNKTEDSLKEFKRRNGFVQIDYPRYYLPLSPVGNLIIRIGLHKGAIGIFPPALLNRLMMIRSKFYQLGQHLGAHKRNNQG